MTFDVKQELEWLKAQAKARRKKHFRPSRLDRYAGELILLRREGAKPAELQRWLREKRIKVELSTVTRWLTKNAQIQENSHT